MNLVVACRPLVVPEDPCLLHAAARKRCPQLHSRAASAVYQRCRLRLGAGRGFGRCGTGCYKCVWSRCLCHVLPLARIPLVTQHCSVRWSGV